MTAGVPASAAVADGLAIALGVTVALDRAHLLRGPALVGGSGSEEAELAAVAGALWSVNDAAPQRLGLLVRALRGDA